MEQKTLQCPHCREMNFPMVEFCRHCGEALHAQPKVANQTLLIKWIHHLIDAMFWIVDESVRWWEIGKLSIQLKSLHRRRATLLASFEAAENAGHESSTEQKQSMVALSEELSRAAGREEFLRSRCWAMTPELLFLAVFCLFLYGMTMLNPGRTFLPRKLSEPGIFSGQVSRVRDLPFHGNTVVTDVCWFNERLYVGGDGGLSFVDPVSGAATLSADLPDDFFVRDLEVDENRMFIGGFSGIYVYENTIMKPFYRENQLPVRLVNAISVSGSNNLLIGTVGRGMLRGTNDAAVFVLGTQNRTIIDFGRQGNELWLLNEDGILTGRADDFAPLNLQVLAGRHLRCMVTTDRNVFIGTDQGVIAGYRNGRNWVWTILSAGKPGYINDIVVSGDILFVASDEGVFRFAKGRMERLSAIPCQAMCIGLNFLAAVNPDSIMLFYFTPAPGDANARLFGPVPEIGTYTPTFPMVPVLPATRLQYGRLPDFGLLETDGKQPLTQSPAATETWSPLEKPFVALPVELQKPVFSDIVKFGSDYLLATENRGVWNYDGALWSQIEGIPESGVSSLISNAKACFAWGEKAGIFKIDGRRAVQLAGSEKTAGLMHVFADADDTLLLLFADGSIKSFAYGELRDLFGIPGEFKGIFNSVWKIGGRYLVVVDKGVMIHESERKWNLVFFKGSIDLVRVAAVEAGSDQNLFVALTDGRIFEFKNEKLETIGVISDQPVAMNFSGLLWVATRESLYFLEKNNFVPAPFKATDNILGAFPVADEKAVLVFTGSGVKSMAGRQ
ncbi:MAG TPA: hypothetical protein PLM07_15680 [Candidatus Rifleibacterium sp.]|nr:hypothetical protein [Candidatus Rifleibacterium sp.]HPT47321.1 hypothetical protein [Candidatus Rifleibacterium sp.]